MFNTTLEKISTGNWRLTLRADAATFASGISAYDIGLTFDVTKAQLSTNNITLASSLKIINDTQLSSGIIVTSAISETAIPASTALAVFNFTGVVNDQLLIGIDRLDLNGVSAAGSKNIAYVSTQKPAGQVLTGTANADRLTSTSGNDTINGAAGRDTVSYSGKASAFAVYSGTNGVTVTDLATGAQDTLSNVERLQFSDRAYAIDMDGSAGKAYRVYKAAFNRDPMNGDTAGLGYWISRIDAGMDMVEVGARFIDSNEFRSLYGSSPSNADFLTRVYQNVLGRTPDASGYNWWLNELNTNPSKTTAKILADFAESAENRTNVANLVGSGVLYDLVSG
jgi:hypothetical protein